jgi:hypothetical protein
MFAEISGIESVILGVRDVRVLTSRLELTVENLGTNRTSSKVRPVLISCAVTEREFLKAALFLAGHLLFRDEKDDCPAADIK